MIIEAAKVSFLYKLDLGFFDYHTTQTLLMSLAYKGKIARKEKI